MPLVEVRMDFNRWHIGHINSLRANIPSIVAAALDVPHSLGALKPEDVAVHFQDANLYDVNAGDVAITIWANYFPERAANFEERQERITLRIRAILELGGIGKRIGSVKVFLAPASFGEW